MGYEFGAIDAVCNFEFDMPGIVRPEWSKTFITEKIGMDGDVINGYSVDGFIEKMDRAGIDHVFLIAVKAGSASQKIHRHISYELVAEVCRQRPDKFSGLAGIDPTMGMEGLREMERGIRDYGFVGAHLYPHWFDMAPDHARYYPFYAKCCELDVPIQMQVGHCLRYSVERPLKSVGRPITLDTIACDFPELKLVGIHIGWPWTEEMISVAYKHPNVYIGSDAYAPKHWPAAFVHFINSWGRKKVIFGTDFPVIDLERAREEIEDLGLRPASARAFLRNNVIDLYKLPLPRVEMPEAAE
ncbi:amidohydrolase [Rhodovulum sp. 12E13]|uniref:amidohydrolase family protein n=1 Tax=Rhodovulum sp. 12E13 TaxID=2203891 RepID=UPI000E1A9DA4|nr:amidohydrolase family protein [Rhodovulum sp. 12E13]RDC71216.1 amidohydrolase [Rhodovulum sp. 12E13]